MGARKPKRVTDAELGVLRVLWNKDSLTAKEITEEVYPGGAESEFASVHSFLQRLERKGLVERDRSGFVHLFKASVSPTEIAGEELSQLVERMGEGSIAPMIMQLVAQKRIGKKDSEEIRRLIDKYSK